jgi:hypothetical protein
MFQQPEIETLEDTAIFPIIRDQKGTCEILSLIHDSFFHLRPEKIMSTTSRTANCCSAVLVVYHMQGLMRAELMRDVYKRTEGNRKAGQQKEGHDCRTDVLGCNQLIAHGGAEW